MRRPLKCSGCERPVPLMIARDAVRNRTTLTCSKCGAETDPRVDGALFQAGDRVRVVRRHQASRGIARVLSHIISEKKGTVVYTIHWIGGSKADVREKNLVLVGESELAVAAAVADSEDHNLIRALKATGEVVTMLRCCGHSKSDGLRDHDDHEVYASVVNGVTRIGFARGARDDTVLREEDTGFDPWEIEALLWFAYPMPFGVWMDIDVVLDENDRRLDATHA